MDLRRCGDPRRNPNRAWFRYWRQQRSQATGRTTGSDWRDSCKGIEVSELTERKPAQSASWHELTIAVPVYSRTLELRHLLESIADMTVLPGEVLLCEDKSPDRQLISQIALEWRGILASKGCALQYVQNNENLGYDGNVRNLFAKATRPWVMLLGNDDAMLPEAILALQRFILVNPSVRMISRTYVRFSTDIRQFVGVTKLSDYDRVYTKDNAEPGLIFRLCGFVGGLVIDRQWACSIATDKYDGTLYYQMYLAAEAFSASGIGYIAAPLVGSRVGNPPLFGSASAEKGIYVPGAYSPKARAAMWQGVMRICADVEQTKSVPIVKSIRRELSGRQSFHVFEMVAAQGRRATLTLVAEFHRLGLTRHPLPWILLLMILLLGRRSRGFFGAVRAVQKWRAGRYRSSLIAGRSYGE
jgi:abequosyltransferase